jgi:Domain of unknown function (DUF389)
VPSKSQVAILEQQFQAAGDGGEFVMIHLRVARSATLIGVLISVTTIPAASDTGVSLAFGSGSEA